MSYVSKICLEVDFKSICPLVCEIDFCNLRVENLKLQVETFSLETNKQMDKRKNKTIKKDKPF